MALSDSSLINGCLRVVPFSHTSGLRSFRPFAEELLKSGEVTEGNRESSHAILLDLKQNETISTKKKKKKKKILQIFFLI